MPIASPSRGRRGGSPSWTLLCGCALLFGVVTPIGGCESRDPAQTSKPSTEPSSEPSESPTPSRGVPTAILREVAREIGVDFRHEPGPEHYYIPQEMGPGGAFLDYDDDGHIDLYLVQGGRLPGTTIGEPSPNRLFRNRGDGTFEDVTERSGAGDLGYGMGCAVADVDADGDSDLYITNVGPDVLLLNDGEGRFSDVTERAGLGDDAFGSSAAFADYDGDGHVDLFVSVYLPWSLEVEKPCYAPDQRRDYCNPTVYPPGQDRLYRNRGDGTFEEVTESAGLMGRLGFGLGAVWFDADGDRDLDLYVANDHQPNFLWINQGDGTFIESATELGCAYNGQGEPEAGMGIVCEDFDSDGDTDLLVSHFYGETNTFYRNERSHFEDATAEIGLGSVGVDDTSFGVVWVDLESDGTSELFFANGAVLRATAPEDPAQPYGERNRLYGWRDGRLFDRSGEFEALSSVSMSRGALRGDIDSDGDWDLVVCNNRGPVEILRNDTVRDAEVMTLRLRGTKSGRDGFGARVTLVESGDRRRVYTHAPHSSYQGTHDARLLVPLSAGRSAFEGLEVEWPSGTTERFTPVGPKALLVEGEGESFESPQESGAPTRVVDADLEPLTATPPYQISTVPFPEGDAFREHVRRALAEGRIDEAARVTNDWVRTALTRVGFDHPQLLESITAFVDVARRSNDVVSAVAMYDKAIEEYEKSGRGDHPFLIRFSASLAQLLVDQGETAGAERAFRRAVELADQNFGTASAQSAAARTALARFWIDTGRLAEAERLTLRTYRAGRAAGASSPELTQLLASAGRLAREDGRLAEAARHYEQAAREFEALGVGPARRAEIAHALGELYLELRDYSRAVERFEFTVRARRETVGAEALETILAESYLGEAQIAQGSVAEGVSALERTLEVLRRLQGEDALATATTERKLALGYAQQKRYTDAIALLEHVAQVYRESYPAGSTATANVEQSLNNLRQALATPSTDDPSGEPK